MPAPKYLYLVKSYGASAMAGATPLERGRGLEHHRGGTEMLVL